MSPHSVPVAFCANTLCYLRPELFLSDYRFPLDSSSEGLERHSQYVKALALCRYDIANTVCGHLERPYPLTSNYMLNIHLSPEFSIYLDAGLFEPRSSLWTIDSLQHAVIQYTF